ncbi:hypothetical protein [Bradyrhizobium australafricanum]|uniref:hypothetical protein n=1 Tax=Bradyrhizobium australafricanum TaxID=2821406 RepID=UPI001CE360A2|nr:hypothetical protein [Bradyrhizobium australafricanum]MCA6099183.1 hypothetical protein [Bradyrhizobium australafricanum]
MQQAASTIPQLFRGYQTANAEKRRVYALAEQAADNDEAADVACDAAHAAAETVADAIFATPFASPSDIATKAQLLLARGDDPADLFHYRPDDLVRFLKEVIDFARR